MSEQWGLGPLDGNEQRTVMCNSALVAVVAHECLTSNLPIMEARARLIAAAPNMLAALESIYGEFVEGQRTTYGDVTATIDRIRETARAAIAKARGK